MHAATGSPKLELNLTDVLAAPFRALRIGHAKILSYSSAMVLLAWLASTELYNYLASSIFNIGISNHNILAIVLYCFFAIAVLFALPLLLAGIAVPVRAIWSYGRLDIIPLLLLTPKTLLHGFRSLLRCLPKLMYSLLPVVGCIFTLQALAHQRLSPWAELLYLIAATALFLIFMRQFLVLGLALTLGAAMQIDIRLAQRAILTSSRARWVQIVLLIGVWGGLASGLVLLDSFYNLNVWFVLSGVVSCFWAFMVSFTLVALQVGFESGM